VFCHTPYGDEKSTTVWRRGHENGSGHKPALSQIIPNRGFQPPGLPLWHLSLAFNTARKETKPKHTAPFFGYLAKELHTVSPCSTSSWCQSVAGKDTEH